MSDPSEVNDLTAGEREELEAEQAGKAPGATDDSGDVAGAADDAGAANAGDPLPAAVAEEQPAPVNESARALADAATQLAEAAKAMRPAEQAPATQAAAAPRDWDGERAALKAKFDAGELDEDAYDAARERLLEDRADARIDEQVHARLAQAEKAASQASWDRTVSAFRADPQNAKVFEDAARQNTFAALVQVAASENPTGSYADWLNAARDRTLAAFNIAAATAVADPAKAAAEIAKSAQQRADAAGKPSRTVDAAPAAGAAVQTGPDASLDALGISDLEDALARLPADKVEQYLAGAPGGLRDNPRAA